MGELLLIGEFSALCQLSVRMLRHYDDIGLLTPAHVDPVTGYRYYHADQLAAAVSIRELRRLEMPLAEIRSLIGSSGREAAQTVLAHHRQRLAEQLADAERRLALIEQLVMKEYPMIDDITEVDVKCMKVAARSVGGPSDMFLPLITVAFVDLFAALQRQGITPIGPPIQVVHRGDEEHFEQEACFPISAEAQPDSETVVRDLDGGPAAVLRHSGPLDEGQLIVHSVMAWIQGRGHQPAMPFRVALVEITVPYR
jgi:DNA-binding transcriptional MerR regulator